MIVKDTEHRTVTVPKWLYLVLVLFGIGGVTYLFLDSFGSHRDSFAHFETSFESISQGFYDGNPSIASKGLQSDQYARTGEHSVFVDKENIYGPVVELDDLVPGEWYEASVWRKIDLLPSTSYFAVQAEDPKELYQNTKSSVRTEGDWELMQLTFRVPDKMTSKTVKVLFYFNSGNDETDYFDDVRVKLMDRGDALPEVTIPEISIYLNSKSARALDENVQTGLNQGILSKDEKQYVKGKLTEDGRSLDVKLRLKGDWTDHIQGVHRSYRVKTSAEESWNRLQEFSLMRPDKRDMLLEWLFHKVLDEEDVLTPRYEFVSLSVNSGPSVPYVVEEHFVKQIIEYNYRREGLILKWNEELMWQSRLRLVQSGIEGHHKLFDDFTTSEILSFDDKALSSDSIQQKLMAEAIGKFDRFIRGEDPSNLMDLDRFAKFFAIAEVFNMHHSVIWHNMRYYYNPITRLIEPIGFDGGEGLGRTDDVLIDCMGCKLNHFEFVDWIEFYKMFYRHEAFLEKFTRHLARYTSGEYINDLLRRYHFQIHQLEAFLQSDFPDYVFDFSFQEKRARKLALLTDAYDDLSILGYTIDKKGGKKKVILTNNFRFPLTISGFSSGENSPIDTTLEGSGLFILNNPAGRKYHYDTVEIPSNYHYVHFKVPGQDNLYSSKIKPWSISSRTISLTPKSLMMPLPSDRYIIEDDGTIHLAPGLIKLTRPLIVPRENNLKISGGTTIDLTNGAYIVSYGPVTINGHEDTPVIITSSDVSGQGITVLGDNSFECKIRFLKINEQTNLTSDGYGLLGSVNFHECDVDIYGSEISNNHCEDALNIVRCNFTLTNSTIHHTYADALDSDFSRGTINNMVFYETGNDATDFSGSQIKISNTTYSNIGDKAVSAGEESSIELQGLEVDGAVIGIASKDLSVVTANDIDIKNTGTGLTAYQKKPEYGGAQIRISDYRPDNVNRNKLHDEQSEIIIE